MYQIVPSIRFKNLLDIHVHYSFQDPGNNGCFDVGHGMEVRTKDTCFKSGKFLGNGSSFTIVDTPGFGDKKERETMEGLVRFLKDDLQFVHVFIIMFNSQEPRLNASLKNMIKMIEEMNSHSFWPNVVIGVSRWKFSKRAIKDRKDIGQSEETWMKDLRAQIDEHTNIDVSNKIMN